MTKNFNICNTQGNFIFVLPEKKKGFGQQISCHGEKIFHDIYFNMGFVVEERYYNHYSSPDTVTHDYWVN